MLCLTGLPLIFHHELEEMLGHNTPLEQVAPGARAPSLDAIVATALKGRPGEVVQYAFFDEERPVVTIGTAPTADAPPETVHHQPADLRTGKLLPPPTQQEGFLQARKRVVEGSV